MSYFESPAQLTTSEMIRQKFGHDDSASVTYAVTQQLKELYKQNVRPLEESYSYDKYVERPMSDGYFDAKPLVLVLGQQSVGKSTFIQHFLGRDFPGMNAGGKSSSTDTFSVITFDHTDQIIPGHVVATDDAYPFQVLGKHGNAFLNHFQLVKTSSELLRDMWFVDTPGIMSGAKQRNRGYKYEEVIESFARMATMIILLFDPDHREINTEFESILKGIRDRNYKDKVKVVLNKATTVPEPKLMRTYGSLLWNLCLAFRTPEEVKIYVSNFPAYGTDMPRNHGCLEMFVNDETELMGNLKDLPKQHAIEKLNYIRKRAMKVKVHAKVMINLKQRLPKFFGVKSTQMDLVDHIKDHIQEVSKTIGIAPNKLFYMTQQNCRDIMMTDNFAKYKTSNKKAFDNLKKMVDVAMPRLMNELSNDEVNPNLARDLKKMNVKVGNVKLQPREKKVKTKDRTKSKNRKTSDTGSVASTASKYSVASFANKMGSAIGKLRRGSKGTYQSKEAASVMSPGSIMDDVMSQITYEKRTSVKRPGETPAKQYSKTGHRHKSVNRQTQSSFVEKSFRNQNDDRLDLFSVVSDDLDEYQSQPARKQPSLPESGYGHNDALSYHEEQSVIRQRLQENTLRDTGAAPPPPLSVFSPKSDFSGNGSDNQPQLGPDDWAVPKSVRKEAKKLFKKQNLNNGKLSGIEGKKAFAKYDVPDQVLRKIWSLVDLSGEGMIDEDQFALAIFLIKKVRKEGTILNELPLELVPPSHRV